MFSVLLKCHTRIESPLLLGDSLAPAAWWRQWQSSGGAQGSGGAQRDSGCSLAAAAWQPRGGGGSVLAALSAIVVAA